MVGPISVQSSNVSSTQLNESTRTETQNTVTNAGLENQARAAMVNDADLPKIENVKDKNFVYPQGGLDDLSLSCSQCSRSMIQEINAAKDSNALQALYQKDDQTCSVQDHGALDVAMICTLSHELSEQNQDLPAADRSKLEGSVLNDLMKLLNSKDADECQNIKTSIEGQLNGRHGESCDKIRNLMDNKLQCLHDSTFNAEALDEAAGKLANKTDPRAVLSVGKGSVNMTNPAGCSVLRTQHQNEELTRLGLIQAGSLQQKIKLEEARGNENCQDEIVQNGITKTSALKLQELENCLDNADLQTLCDTKANLEIRANYELTAADKQTFDERLSSQLDQKTQDMVAALTEQGIDFKDLTLGECRSLLQGVGFNGETLKQLCEAKPDLVSSYKEALAEPENARGFVDSLMFAVKGGAASLQDGAVGVSASLGSAEADGRISRAMKSRAEFDLEAMRMAPALNYYGLNEFKFETEDDLKALDSKAMMALEEKVINPQNSALKQARDNLGLAMINLSFKAFAAEHPGCKATPNDNPEFIQAHSPEVQKLLPGLMKDRNLSLVNNISQAFASSALLKAFAANPGRLALLKSVKEALESNPEAAESDKQLRKAIAGLIGINTQGSQLDNMPLSQLIDLAAKRLPQALSATNNDEAVNALKSMEKQGSILGENEKSLYAAQTAELMQLQNVDSPNKTSGETLAVNLFMLQDLLSDEVSDLSPFQLARMGIDKNAYMSADSAGKQTMLLEAMKASQEKAGEFEYQVLADEYLKLAEKDGKSFNESVTSLGNALPDASATAASGVAHRRMRSTADKLEALNELSLMKGKLKADLNKFGSSSVVFGRPGSDGFEKMRAVLNDPSLSDGDKLKQLRSEFKAVQEKAQPHDLMGLSAASVASKKHISGSTPAQSVEYAADKSGLGKSKLSSELSADFYKRSTAYVDSGVRHEQAVTYNDKALQDGLKNTIGKDTMAQLQAAACELTAQRIGFFSGAQMFEAYADALPGDRSLVDNAIKQTLKEQFNCSEGNAEILMRSIRDVYSANTQATKKLNSGLHAVATNAAENHIQEAAKISRLLEQKASSLQPGTSMVFKTSAGVEAVFDIVPEVITGTASLKAGAQASIGRSEDGKSYEVSLSSKLAVALGLKVSAETELYQNPNDEDKSISVGGSAGASVGVKGTGTLHLKFDNAEDASLFMAHALCGLAAPDYAHNCGAEAIAATGVISGKAGFSASAGANANFGGLIDSIGVNAAFETVGKIEFAKTSGTDGNINSWAFKMSLKLELSLGVELHEKISEPLSNVVNNISPENETAAAIVDFGKEGLKKEGSFEVGSRIEVNTDKGGYPVRSGKVTFTVSPNRYEVEALCDRCKLSPQQRADVLKQFDLNQQNKVEMKNFTLTAEVNFEQDPHMGIRDAKEMLLAADKNGTLKFTSASLNAADEKLSVEHSLSVAGKLNFSYMRNVMENSTQTIALKA